jgi:hypothetical protein
MTNEPAHRPEAWASATAALTAITAGDSESFDLHIATGGIEAVRTLGVMTAVLFMRWTEMEAAQAGMPDGGGTTAEWLDSLREAVIERYGAW